MDTHRYIDVETKPVNVSLEQETTSGIVQKEAVEKGEWADDNVIEQPDYKPKPIRSTTITTKKEEGIDIIFWGIIGLIILMIIAVIYVIFSGNNKPPRRYY